MVSLLLRDIVKKGKNILLKPENDSFDPIVINDDSEAYIWGVVTNVIHNL